MKMNELQHENGLLKFENGNFKSDLRQCEDSLTELKGKLVKI